MGWCDLVLRYEGKISGRKKRCPDGSHIDDTINLPDLVAKSGGDDPGTLSKKLLPLPVLVKYRYLKYPA